MNFINKTPKITKNIIALNIIMFIITPFLSSGTLRMMLGHPLLSDDFNPIQPLTSMFLHIGFMHLFMNILVIWMIGKTIEHEIGTKKYLILYLLSGFGGWLLYILFSTVPFVGASGAGFGLITSIGVLFPNKKVNIMFIPFFSVKLKWVVIIYCTFEFINIILPSTDNVAHVCHLGGALTGFWLTGFWLTNKFSDKLKSLKNK